MHLPMTMAKNGETLAERSPLEYWTRLAVLHTLTSSPALTVTPEAATAARALAEAIRVDRGLPRPTGLRGGTAPMDIDDPSEREPEGGTSGSLPEASESRRRTVEGLSPLARQAYDTRPSERETSLSHLPQEQAAALRGRAETLLRRHFPPTAHLPFGDANPRLEMLLVLDSVQYALTLGEGTVAPEAAASELAELYAERHPRGFRSAGPLIDDTDFDEVQLDDGLDDEEEEPAEDLEAAFQEAFRTLMSPDDLSEDFEDDDGGDADREESRDAGGEAGEDYLLFAEARRPGREIADQDPQEGLEEEHDGASMGDTSWVSDFSQVSFAEELMGAGLKTLEQAADAEASAWAQAQPTDARARTRRQSLMQSIIPRATAYPALVSHMNNLVTRPVNGVDIAKALTVLALTPQGLALPVEQLGVWLSPFKPLDESEIERFLVSLGHRNSDVPTRLGARERAPGEETDGERRESVAAALERTGIAVWDRKRLTGQAVTVFGTWIVRWGTEQAHRRRQADSGAIAEALFGHRGERATAFVEFHLTLASIPHAGAPLLWGRDSEDIEDDDPVTETDRVLLAVSTASAHAALFGAVNALEIAKIVAGHDQPNLREIQHGLDVLEFSGHTGHVRGTTLWDLSTTVTDASLEAHTAAAGEGAVRAEDGELTDRGRELLKGEVLRIASRQTARLGGVDLDALVPQIMAVRHHHSGRRTVRRWLHEADLPVLTPHELPIAQLLDAVRTSRHEARSQGVTRDFASFDPDFLTDILSDAEPDPALRLLRAQAVLEAASVNGRQTMINSATFLEMMTACALLEQDAAESRAYARRSLRLRRGINPALLRRMARESRRDSLHYIARNVLPHLPQQQAVRLADTWHHTFAYLTRLGDRGTEVNSTEAPPDVLPNVLAEFTARAKAAVAAQRTYRPDYASVAAELFGPNPTAEQIAVAAGLAPAPLTVSAQTAKATAEAIVAVMDDAEPFLPADATLGQKIDYFLWEAAHTIVHGGRNGKVKIRSIAERTFGRVSVCADCLALGWLLAFGLGGALRHHSRELDRLSSAREAFHEARDEFRIVNFSRLAERLAPSPSGRGRGRGRGRLIFLGMYQAWGLDDAVIPEGGVRHRLAVAARSERGRGSADEPTDVAAAILGTEDLGVDHVLLFQELLRPDLNLEDAQLPGAARTILDAFDGRRPRSIPGTGAHPAQRKAWADLDEDSKLARRIEIALYTAVQKAAGSQRISFTTVREAVFPDVPAHSAQKQWIRSWLIAFGLEGYSPFRRGDALHMTHMDQVFDEAWERIDTGESLFAPQIWNSVTGRTATRQTRHSVKGWFQAMGLVDGGIPPGSVRDRILDRVEELMEQGVDDPTEMAKRVLKSRRPYPSQVVAVQQMMRLRSPRAVQVRLSELADHVLQRHHDQGVLTAPNTDTTLQQRIDYAIWRTQSDITRGQKIPLDKLTALVFAGAPHTTLDPSRTPHATSPIGRTTRRYFLLGVLSAAGLSYAYRMGPHAAKSLTAIAGEYLLQKSVDKAGASPHSTARELLAHHHLPHPYRSFIWGVLETFGLRTRPLPATGIRARMKQATARSLGQDPDVSAKQAALELFGTSALSTEGLAVTSLWMRLAATDLHPNPLATATGGTVTPPPHHATLAQQTDYVVAATLHLRSQPQYAGDDVGALVKDLFGTRSDPFGLALVTGILQGTALTGLDDSLTLREARLLHHNARTQQLIFRRIVVSLAIDAAIPLRRDHHHARARGLLAGRGILPAPTSDGPLHRVHKDVIEQARAVQSRYGALDADDIDQIAYDVLRLTEAPDDHQRHVITEILSSYGIAPGRRGASGG
ncbi:hypothetical protein, partial [Streptomyces sp. NPDC058548]|uniref:hypothetical protein n=1 Tax=Streptomyces sp. NPDC058548 TaxID=3346545 RepID=UPI00364E2053